MTTFYDGSGSRYSILEGAHEADIGEIGVAYCESVARKFAAADDLIAILKFVLTTPGMIRGRREAEALLAKAEGRA